MSTPIDNELFRVTLSASPDGVVQGAVLPDGAPTLLWIEAPDAPWVALGGSFTTAPVTVTAGDGTLWAFVRAEDGTVHANARPVGARWSGWTSLGGGTKGAPAACLDAEGRVAVFARGLDDAIWHTAFEGAVWSGWSSLGGQLRHSPAAVLTREGRLTVFAVGTDKSVWHCHQAKRWSGWSSLEGQTEAAPAAVVDGAGVLRVFVRGLDGGLWARSYEGQWTPWTSLGGGLADAPTAALDRGGSARVRVVGTDRRTIFERAWTNAWSDYAVVGELPKETDDEVLAYARQRFTLAVARAVAAVEAGPSADGELLAHEAALVGVLRAAPALVDRTQSMARRGLTDLKVEGATSERMASLVQRATPAFRADPAAEYVRAVGLPRARVMSGGAAKPTPRLTVAFRRVACVAESVDRFGNRGGADDLYALLTLTTVGEVHTSPLRGLGDYDSGTVLVDEAIRDPKHPRGVGLSQVVFQSADLPQGPSRLRVHLIEDDSISEDMRALVEVLHTIGLVAIAATVYYYTGDVKRTEQAVELADRIARSVAGWIEESLNADDLGSAEIAVYPIGMTTAPIRLTIQSAAHKSHYEVDLSCVLENVTENLPIERPAVPTTEMVPYLPGTFRSIAGASDGSDVVWAVTGNGGVRRGDGTRWQTLAGTVLNVSVGTPAVVHAASSAQVSQRWEGDHFGPFDPLNQPAQVSQVAVGADGTVWAISATDGRAMYFRPERMIPSTHAALPVQVQMAGWEVAGPALASVSVGDANHVWGIGRDGKVYRRVGTTFQAIESPGIVQVSVCAGGSVWAVDAQGALFTYVLDAWQSRSCSVALRQVSVSSNRLLWGLDMAGNVYRWWVPAPQIR